MSSAVERHLHDCILLFRDMVEGREVTVEGPFVRYRETVMTKSTQVTWEWE